jgi:Transposase DDE domain group 1
VTGQAKEVPLRPTLDRRIKLEFHGARITSDGGLLAYRELDDALGLTDIAITKAPRPPPWQEHAPQAERAVPPIGVRSAAGYEDVNDAKPLAHDPAMRAVVGGDGFDGVAASSSQMGRFETAWLATDVYLEALTDLSGTWIVRVHARKAPEGIILDMVCPERAGQQPRRLRWHICRGQHSLGAWHHPSMQ